MQLPARYLRQMPMRTFLDREVCGAMMKRTSNLLLCPCCSLDFLFLLLPRIVSCHCAVSIYELKKSRARGYLINLVESYSASCALLFPYLSSAAQ